MTTGTATLADTATGLSATRTATFTVMPPLIPAQGAWWGAYIGPIAADGSTVTSFEAKIGRKLGVVTQYHDWKAGQTWPTAVEKTLCAPGTGRKLMIHQELRIFATNTYIQASAVTAGTYDAQITAQAQQVAAWGQPCWYVFEAEPDNAANTASYSSPDQMVAAWRHVHDIWTAQGATNAQWVWCVTGSNTGADQALYPGSAYVDWYGWDPYTWGFSAWSLPAARWAVYRNWLRNQAWADQAKPCMLCETGVDGGTWVTSPQAASDWWAAAPAGIAPAGLKAVVAFNRNAGTNANWLVDDKPAVLAAFKAAGLNPLFNP